MVNFIVELRPKQLEMITGENTVSISRCVALKKKIESLLEKGGVNIVGARIRITLLITILPGVRGLS